MAGHEVSFGQDAGADVLLVDDLLSIAQVRSSHPRARIGLLDPKLNGRRGIANARDADFVVVSSLEQQLQCQASNSNAFVYPWFLSIPQGLVRTPRNEPSPVRIGYHGNRQHLEAMSKTVTPALESVGDAVEFVAIYNIAVTGRWRRGRPRGVKLTEVQWTPDTWMQNLASCDIGVVPAFLPSSSTRLVDSVRASLGRIGLNPTGKNAKDFRTRFKFSTNLNRLYPFVAIGVPVVSDVFPSACTVIEHGKTGYLAYDGESWTQAIAALASSEELRREMATLANRQWPVALTPESLAARFVAFLEIRADSLAQRNPRRVDTEAAEGTGV
jgi:hypothetical protein